MLVACRVRYAVLGRPLARFDVALIGATARYEVVSYTIRQCHSLLEEVGCMHTPPSPSPSPRPLLDCTPYLENSGVA